MFKDKYHTYLTKKEDTLPKISFQFYGLDKYSQYIAEFNNLYNTNFIRPGKLLKLPMTIEMRSTKLPNSLITRSTHSQNYSSRRNSVNNHLGPIETDDKFIDQNQRRVKTVKIKLPYKNKKSKFLILIAKSKNNPGYDLNGIPSEDMKYSKFARLTSTAGEGALRKYLGSHSACGVDLSPTSGLIFKSDNYLFKQMRLMSNLFARGYLNDNIMQMIQHFQKNTGTEYRNQALNKAVRNHSSMKRFVISCKKALRTRLIDCDISKIGHSAGVKNKLLDNKEFGRVHFTEMLDKFNGLGIAVHDTAAYKVELLSFNLDDGNFKFNAKAKFTIYDHFGLDKRDLKKFGAASGFRAWYILQHLRGYKPFLTVIENEFVLRGTLCENSNL